MIIENYINGEVVVVNLGSVERGEIKGHEQAKKRPCVVIKEFSKRGLLIIVPFTTTQPKSNTPYYVTKILPTENNGLTEECNALCNQIRTVSVERVETKLGILDDIDFKKIQATLLDTLEL